MPMHKSGIIMFDISIIAFANEIADEEPFVRRGANTVKYVALDDLNALLSLANRG